MKQLLFLSLVFLTVSCEVADEQYRAYQNGLKWDRIKEIRVEWVEFKKMNPTCDEWETKLKEFSKKLKKYGPTEKEKDPLRLAKLWIDFKILFVQGRYAEAYAMGMDGFFQATFHAFGREMQVELAITAKILGRFPEFQQKVDLWKHQNPEKLRSQFESIVTNHCDDSLKDMGILEWVETLERPTKTTQY